MKRKLHIIVLCNNLYQLAALALAFLKAEERFRLSNMIIDY